MNSSREVRQFHLSQALIRPWTKRDAHSLARYANNRSIWLNLTDAFPHPYALSNARAFIEKASASEDLLLAIEVQGDAVGGIGLHSQRDVGRLSAEIGYWLGEPFWSRGIVTEAVTALTDYAFDSLGLLRVYARVFEWNLASMRVLEKAGYALEGRLKMAVTKDGKTIDEVIYAAIRGVKESSTLIRP